MLASALIDQCDALKQSRAIPSDSEAYYFYCSEMENGHNNGLGFAKAMAAQLLDNQPDLLPVFTEFAKTSGEVTLASIEKARELLLLGLETERRQYFVIDGLDTCDFLRARSIVSAFNQIMRDKSLAPGASRPRILLTGCLTQEMKSLVGDVVVAPIRPEDNLEDIGRYTRASLQQIQARIPALSQVDAEYIQRKVAQQSRGKCTRRRCFTYLSNVL